MKKLISEQTLSDLTKLGIYQIGGGGVGILIVVWAIYKNMTLSVITSILYLLILAFFSFSIFYGFLCTKAKKNALKYSFINQVLQIAGFAAFGFAFNYIAGFYFIVGLDLSETFEFSFGVGISKVNFVLNSDSEKLQIDFNIVAFIIVIWIDKLMKRVKAEIELRTISSLGEN
jgi:hypothetical protein